MPRNVFKTRFGLLSQLDLRSLSGVTLYDRGGSSVVMPSFSGVGVGLYDDALAFLNGRGALTAKTFAVQLESIWNAATGATPNVTVEIDTDDKLRIEADLVFAINATVGTATFGVNTAGQTAVLVAGPRYQLIADNDWLRGSIDDVMVFSVPSAVIIVPAAGYTVQDLPTLINTKSGDTLESLEDAAGYDVWWYVDDDGHAAWASPSSAAISWASTDFRDLLGFTVNEAVTLTAPSTYGSTSTYPIAGVLVPSREVVRQPPRVHEESSFMRTDSNGLVGVLRNTFPQHALDFHLDGPLDCKDEMSHWLKKCMPRLSNGRRINFYQDWGDSRLAANVWAQDYGDTYTVELDGFRGRIEGWVADNGGARAMTFPFRLRRRIPLSIIIEERGLT